MNRIGTSIDDITERIAAIRASITPERQAEIDAEFAAYEAEHGPLEPVELNWDLLIFGPAGYGPPD